MKQYKRAVSFHLGKKVLCWELHCQQPSLCQALALFGSPEMAPSKPAGGELKRRMFPRTQRTPGSPSKRLSFLPCGRGPGGLLGRCSCGKRRWEIPPGSTARCSRPFSLLLACEDGYKLENETCVRYGDCSALLLPHHPCSGDLLVQLSC